MATDDLDNLRAIADAARLPSTIGQNTLAGLVRDTLEQNPSLAAAYNSRASDPQGWAETRDQSVAALVRQGFNNMRSGAADGQSVPFTSQELFDMSDAEFRKLQRAAQEDTDARDPMIRSGVRQRGGIRSGRPGS